MSIRSAVRTAFAMALLALLGACGDASMTELATTEIEKATPEIPNGLPPVSMSTDESGITIGDYEEDDDSETIGDGGGGGLGPDTKPFVTLHTPANAEAGSSFTISAQVLSLAQTGSLTYKVWAIPGYVAGQGPYLAHYWQGTVTGGVVNITAPAAAAVIGTTRFIFEATNVNGSWTERKNVPVLPRRPRFFTGADFLPATRVAGFESWVDLNMSKPAQPTAPDYVLPLTVDFGDGRTQSFDWDIVEAWGGAYKSIPMSWPRPGTYSVTFKVAATNAPAYTSTHTESITILPNPAWPHITNFQSPAQVNPGKTYQLTFDPGGPEYPGELFQVRTYRENGSFATTFVHPGVPATIVYDWPNELGEAWQTTIVSGTIDGVLRADTIRWSAMVVAEPIVIGNFVGPVNAQFGEPASFSFKASGGPGSYTATITYGDGSPPTVVPITQGTTVTRSHTWAASGVWDLTIVVSNGSTSTTRTEKITVYRPRPTIDDLSIPDVLHFFEQSAIYFVPNDATTIERMVYQIFISHEGDTNELQDLIPQGVPVQYPIQAPDFAGVFEIRIVVSTVLNGLILQSDTASHTLTVEDLVCPAGSYRDAFTCVPAPAGTYVPAAGALEAIPCAVGSYQDQTGQTSCKAAPAGSFVPVTGATQAQLCPLGTWQDQSGSASCKPAQPGHFVDQLGATHATACAAGTYQPAAGSSSCNQASPGSYVAASGATQATLCSPGTYQPAAGSTSCDPAAPGSYVSISGAAQATLCAPGTYQPASGQTSCVEAPVGSYVDVAGATAATPCPVTTSTAGTGSSSAAQCIPLGQIAMAEIEQAVSDGTLVPASGQQKFNVWLSALRRAFEFLEGNQQQVGCSGVRNALAQADGLPSPNDVVTGPARAGVEAALRRILAEYGC